jgi:uncharacterized DUF497 family protein
VPRLYVESFVFDETNRPKLKIHGVTIREIYEVLDDDPKPMRNHSVGAPWILIGLTVAGRFLTLPLDSTGEEGVWRPRTGYDSSKKERRRYDSE